MRNNALCGVWENLLPFFNVGQPKAVCGSKKVVKSEKVEIKSY